jgi:hypothetical protein
MESTLPVTDTGTDTSCPEAEHLITTAMGIVVHVALN